MDSQYDQVEKVRNRLLRRADWRYLLNNPWPEKSICFSDGLLAQSVEMISSQMMAAEQNIQGGCDLVVATNPDSTTLKKAWQALQSGGSFYSEWNSPLAGGPIGIRKRLEAAHFTNVVCYWPWPIPSLSSPLFWLPLESVQVVRYFLSERNRPENRIRRLGNSLLHTIWKLAWKTGMLAPICVTATKEEPVDKTILSIGSNDELIVNWVNGKTGNNPRSFDALMWTGGKRSINKVILYLFTGEQETPRLIVKFPRAIETVPSLTHEAQVLLDLHAQKKEAAVSAPAVLFLNEKDGMVVLGETVVYGQPLYEVMNHGNTLELAIKMIEWLASLVSTEAIQPHATWWEKWAEPALLNFELDFKEVLDNSQLNKCRAILNRLGDLPEAFEHRDFAPWNVLITASNELAVLDWESAEQHGLPGIDLFYFLAYLVFFMDGAMEKENYTESYRRALDPTTNVGAVMAASQRRYIECTGLDPVVLQPLRLLTWLTHVHFEVRRLAFYAGQAPSPAALRGSLFYNLLLEDLAQVKDESYR